MKKLLILFILLLLVACGGQSKEELAQEGDRLQADGNHRGAIVLYKNALEKDVNYLDARLGLANAYLDSGSFDRAEKEFQKVLLQNPSMTSVLLNLAKIHIQQKSPEQALLDLDSFHSDNHETVESLVLYGRAHAISQDLESAEKLFKKALSLDPQAIDPKMNLAKVYLQKKNLDKAAELLAEVIAAKADHAFAYYLLADIRLNQGQSDVALELYNQLLNADPSQPRALYMSGMLQIEKNDFSAAEISVKQLMTRFSDNPDGSRLKGILDYRQGRFEDAKVALENSLKQQQHLLSYFFLGLSYFGLDQYELALNQFQKALDISPEFERARVLVAMTLLKQKRLADAIVEIQKVLRRNPDNAYAHNILGSALLADGQYDEGMKELDLATELEPTLVDAHMKKGLFKLSHGNEITGEADLLKAVEAAPEIMNSRLMLVTHYLRQKDYTSAIDLLKDGINGSESDALLNNYLAAAYFAQKKPDLAVTALRQAIKANPAYLTPYFNIASYYASRSQYDLAVIEYQHILTQDSANIRAILGLAAIYNVMGDQASVSKAFEQAEATGSEQGFFAAAQHKLRNGDNEGASHIIERGLQAHQRSSQLLELSGLLALQNSQYEQAESAFITLTGVVPERGNTLLVRLYLQSGQNDKAQKLIDELLVTDGNSEYPYLLSAGLLRQQKKNETAVAVLEKGIAKVETPLRLKMQLGAFYEQAGQGQKAEQIYQRIIQSVPRFSPAYTSLGFIKESSGHKGDALELYKKALSYDNKSVPALNNLAYLLVDNFGDETAALDFAMSAYKLQPGDPRIMDTLGYVLVKNGRAKDALNLLNKAHEMLPEMAAVTLHLAQAKAQLGQHNEARSLLEIVKKTGQQEDVRQADKLLQTF